MSELRELFEYGNRDSTTNFFSWAYDMLEALIEAVEPEERHCGDCRSFNPNSVIGCDAGPLGVPVRGLSLACGAFRASPQAVEPEAERESEEGPVTEQDKTCRTCRRLYPQWRCTRHHVYTDPSESCEFHESHESCETSPPVDELAEAKTEIARLQRDKDVFYKTRTFISDARIVAERELAEAKAEIERLREQRDEWAEKAVATAGASTLFVVPNKEFEADAKIGELVRGMRGGSSLRRTTACLDRPDWLAHWSGAGGMIIINSGSGDPAEALRSIQASE